MAALWIPDSLTVRAQLLDWAGERVGETFSRDGALPVAVLHGPDLAAVVIYHSIRGGSVEIVAAAETPRWATVGVLAEILSWPFANLNARRLVAVIRGDNTRSRRLVKGLGFQIEGWLREAFEDCDGALYAMTRSDWLTSRWARVYHARHPLEEAA